MRGGAGATSDHSVAKCQAILYSRKRREHVFYINTDAAATRDGCISRSLLLLNRSLLTRGYINTGAAATRDGYIVVGSTDKKLYFINGRTGACVLLSECVLLKECVDV